MGKKPLRIYCVNPKNPENFWTMESSVRAVGAKTLMPNAALATLMACTPEGMAVRYLYCDENVRTIDFDTACDLVAVTGFTLHADRIREICAAFRARGVPVALGGVYATLYPSAAQRIADHVFIGEAEHTWPIFLSDWTSGAPKHRYVQETHIDLRESPAPRWSHIRSGDYLYFAVQTSRGCPNNCDFCDAIRIVGRRYRTKSIPQIMREIRNAYDAGAETVFFSEDNFFVNRTFTVELLQELIRWNRSVRTPLSFSCQATVRIGEDEEVLRLMADAKFSVIFLGVETIRPQCLREVNKGHLASVDPYRSVMNISAHGILPFVGLIVGFDHDDQDTFGELERYIEATCTPFASITVLSAPEHTVLYERLRSQGRISGGFDGKWHFSTNIVPVQMTLHALLAGHRWL
ncbi:MAG: B12-binding domain-containing radical SAM protein, partial [Spirochaetes bacterium]|nr:B12-binding domain-containing radical SAM protein [Spirochaetota bacterium]